MKSDMSTVLQAEGMAVLKSKERRWRYGSIQARWEWLNVPHYYIFVFHAHTLDYGSPKVCHSL